MNRLHGFLEDRREWADRGNLTVLPKDRKLTVDFYNLDSRITGIQYEIRSMEDESLIERTADKDWHQDGGAAEAVTILPIQNLIDKAEEYIRPLPLPQKISRRSTTIPGLSDGRRLFGTDDPDGGNIFRNAFHYEKASDLTTFWRQIRRLTTALWAA